VIYSYASLFNRYGDFGLFRVTGRGLGNLLFPWARWVVATRRQEWTPIAPTWFQINLTREPRFLSHLQRHYVNMFQRRPGEIGGLRKLRLLASRPRLGEQDYQARLRLGQPLPDEHIVQFSGMKGFFADILRDHILVREELMTMTRPRHRRGLNHDFSNSMAVHIRLGDFSSAGPTDPDRRSAWNVRLPLSWYTQAVQTLRTQLGLPLKIYVFSDGSDRELREFLDSTQALRLDFGSSAADLLALSNARLLVASGSTFSMWASYLGRMPVIWHPGQWRQALYHEGPGAETEWSPGDPLSPDFLACARQALTGPHARSMDYAHLLSKS
jgi:hypothetical protein